MAMILKLSCIFGVELSLLPLIQQQKREKYFANNRAWKTDIPADIQLKKDHKLVWVGEYLICVKCPPYEVQAAFLSHSGYKPHPGGGYSHSLPIRVNATQRGRDFEAPDLERGIHFRGIF